MPDPTPFHERRKYPPGYPGAPGYPNNPQTPITGSANDRRVKCITCNNVIFLEPGIDRFWPVECTLCRTVYAGDNIARLPMPTGEQIAVGIGALEEYANIRGNFGK